MAHLHVSVRPWTTGTIVCHKEITPGIVAQVSGWFGCARPLCRVTSAVPSASACSRFAKAPGAATWSGGWRFALAADAAASPRDARFPFAVGFSPGRLLRRSWASGQQGLCVGSAVGARAGGHFASCGWWRCSGSRSGGPWGRGSGIPVLSCPRPVGCAPGAGAFPSLSRYSPTHVGGKARTAGLAGGP